MLGCTTAGFALKPLLGIPTRVSPATGLGAVAPMSYASGWESGYRSRGQDWDDQWAGDSWGEWRQDRYANQWEDAQEFVAPERAAQNGQRAL